ncbi:hypothetical protein [Streptomyces sp. 8N706]|uniref:hypothetical protein n=1 Tax=Streptomyces sp. 8N706 TaxID=3457416 RepID=UPI003FCF6CF5
MTGVPTRPGPALAVNVLGVGALFLPWTAKAAHGTEALLGWGYHIVAGALLVAALTSAAQAPGAGKGAVPLTDEVLGEVQGRAIRCYYVLGITAGQIVVALVAAGFLAQALGPDQGGAGAGGFIGWAAAGVLALAVALAPSSRKAAPLVVFGAILVLLVAALALGSGPVPGPASPSAGGLVPVGQAAALQFFVVVGWEAASRLAPATGRRRLLGPLGGVAAVGILYGSVLWAAPSVGTDRTVAGLALPELSGSGPGRAVAAGLALVAVSFCVNNIRGAAQLAAGLTSSRPQSGRAVGGAAAVLGAVAMAGVALVQGGQLSATDALAVPNAMACAVFLTVAAAAVRASDGRRRGLGVAALAAYLPLLPFLGTAVLIPVAVLAGSALLAALRPGKPLTEKP